MPTVPEPKLEIVPYDPQWPACFNAEATRLRTALGRIALRIDHNGSTAVPGLAAKPTIDIQISVAQLSPLAIYRDPLKSIGYVHVPHADDSFCPFFHRPAQWPHSHHVHVVQAGGDEERKTLAFRDYLREHSDVADQYLALKMKLAAATNADDAAEREAYANAKSEFIDGVVRLALSQGYPRKP